MTSIRGDRTSVYRERDDRDQDEAPRRTYTTIKRYQIPDSASSVSRSVHRDDKEETKEKIIIRRERKDESPPRRERDKREVDYRVTERVIESEPRRDIQYRVVERDFDRDDSRSQIRVIERDRETVRAPSEERVREFRFERERDWDEPEHRPYELERYSKSTEYFQQPQPIIIRERAAQPIIIREERREPQRIIIRREEPQYEFVERKEVEDKSEVKSHVTSLVKREEPPPPAVAPEQPPQEDYFYERRVVERRRRSDSFDRHTEVRPRDSASQYSSDDSYEYVRRERTYESDKRDMSPHHKRHLAEGAIAGIAAGEILRHHRKSQGEAVGNRAVSGIAGGVVGALGAEGLTRLRSRSRRRRSRSRSWSGERDHRDRDRRRSRSDSRGKHFSQTEKLGGLAVVAAGAALVGYALNNKNKGKETVVIKDGSRRRRKSRRRGGSADTYLDDDRLIKDETKHRDPEHRNRRIAQAGLVSAAGAALLERARSKSRGGARSKSKIRQALPVVASGLGGAALAGLYEKNQANKEAKKQMIIEDEVGRGRGRSRSRSAAPYGRSTSRGMVAYGDDPVRTDSDYGYYSDEEPGVYRRRRGGSDSSSPDRRQSRSRSRVRNLAAGAAGGSAAGYAAHAYGDRNRDARRDDHYDDYSDQGPYSPVGRNEYAHAQPRSGGYDSGQQNNYPGGHYFPPPPENDYNRQQAGNGNNYPAYNPADYANQAPQNPVYGSGAYGESTGNLGQRGVNDNPSAGGHAVGEGNRGRDAGNVSSFSSPAELHRQHEEDRRQHERDSQGSDGLSTPQLRSPSRVRFNLGHNTVHSPDPSINTKSSKYQATVSSDASRDSWESWTDSDSGDGKQTARETGSPEDHRGLPGQHPPQRHRQFDHEERDDNTQDARRGGRPSTSRAHHRQVNDELRSGSTISSSSSDNLMRDQYDRRPSISSDDTVELPSRFDKDGNRKPDDPLAQQFSDVLSGKGGVGGLLKSLADKTRR